MSKKNNSIKEKIIGLDDKIQNLEKSYLDNRCELSIKQRKSIQEKKEKYFGELKKNSDSKHIERLLGSYGIQVYKSYLPYVSENYIPVFDNSQNMSNRVISFDITRWVVDTEEKNIEKLINVYEVLSNDNCSIALIYDRKVNGTTVTISIANLSELGTPDIVSDFAKKVVDAIHGNFPGSVINETNGEIKFHMGTLSSLQNAVEYEQNDDDIFVSKSDSVAVITNIPSDKSEDFISQSIEKLLDGIVPTKVTSEYQLVLLASPNKDISSQKSNLFNLYSSLAPYSTWQSTMSAGITEGEGMTSNLNKNLGVSASVGISSGINIELVNANMSKNIGANFGVAFGKSANRNTSLTKNETVTDTYTNYGVKHALELIEKNVNRLEECSALGMWNFAAYAISSDAIIANNVASMYLALTQGEDSYLFQPSINFWHGTRNKENAASIIESIKNMEHPKFILNESLIENNEDDLLMLPNEIDLTSLISGKELVRSLNFPRKSIVGFPVIECATFGRNVITYNDFHNDEKLNIGKIFHMNKTEKTTVDLSLKSLTSHMFITGSTGSGKSNTVYHILNEARNQNVKFLVVEPAKGEYKNVFGNDKDVNIYGTNPKLTPLLKLNPFSFPENIHVLEHIDRLVEIFNACWPMYAAMPAVLKKAVEESYIDCGWNLLTSRNKYEEDLYPSFDDVTKNIKYIIDTSEYDNENKGAYKGSLLTRLESLTNGINGSVFSCDEFSNEEIFDENVIIDLSRVGSVETKSLIMGVLVMKLQEYRMSESKFANSNLRHITVLEEAHNLLRRTSYEQSSDSSNLQGKSVEMISNAIAEMRTYGEGFIIADQAPGLMDMSVIRNTNTKIIMRLPDQGDRELVGKSANLNNDQITELSKLPCGVAAVYQNDWIYPVLCKINKSSKEFCEYKYCTDIDLVEEQNAVKKSLLDCLMDENLLRNGDNAQIIKLKNAILRSGLSSMVKNDFLEYISSDEENSLSALRKLLYDFLSASKAIESSRNCNEIKDWVDSVVNNLNPSVNSYTKEQINLIIALIVYEQSIRDFSYNDILCRFSEVFKSEGSVY